MRKNAVSSKRTDETTIYAFRHRQSGVLVRLDVESNRGRNDCGDETCRLSLNPQFPIFQVPTPLDLAIVMQRDERWYNSSRSRPMWNGLDAKALEVVSIQHTMTYEGPVGADPVEERKTIQPYPFPGFVNCTRLKARRLPTPLIRRYFNLDLSRDELSWSDFALVSFAERPNPDDIIGQFLSPGITYDNTGIVEALIDMPEDYPIEGSALTHIEKGEHLMVALINLGTQRFNLQPTGDAPRP